MTAKHARTLSAAALVLALAAAPVAASPLTLGPNAGLFDTFTVWIVEVASHLFGFEKGTSCIDPNGNPVPCDLPPALDGGSETESGCSVDPNGTPCTPKP